MRIGHGYDVHRLVPGRKLILGGVEIPFERGLDGHSDADVLTHALMDALLGAACLGDIGLLFPDNDPQYKGISSLLLLEEVVRRVHAAGFAVGNADITVLPAAEAPAPYSHHAGTPARPARHGGRQCQGDDRGRPRLYGQRRGHRLPRRVSAGGMHMKTLLITGFEPFGGETINPAWEAVKALPEQIGGWQLRKLQIPTVFGLAAARTLACAAECRPDAVLCIGQAGTRSAVTPEYVGINLRHARIADNLGNQPQDEPVVPGGPTAYFATVPVRAMTAAIEAQGIPAAVSYTAGTYVCNDLLYTLLHHYAETPVRAGFIHVPFLPEQAPQGVASMPLAQMIRALEAAVSAL